MNNGKYNTDEFKKKQSASKDRKFGPIETHTKICEQCGITFSFTGRAKSKKFEQARFCSRSCASSVGGSAKATIHHSDSKAHYRTVAFRHRNRHCYACGHNRILEVHHLDGNHTNNNPDNLIPLCPTHHKMIHSKWKNEVYDLLKNKQFYGK